MKHRIGGASIAGLGAFILFATGIAGVSAQSPKSGPQATEFTDISQLKDAFNKDSGAIRLVLLLSPT